MAGYTTGTANELTNDGTWTYTYDAVGNLTKKSKGASAETWTFGYDDRNQMTSAEDRSTDGGTLTLKLLEKYDVFGRRIEEDRWTQATGTVVTRFGYDGDNVLVDLNASNQLLTRYIRPDGVNALGARESSGGTIAWYLTNYEGSVIALTDNTGVVQDKISYGPFGNVASETSPSFGDRWKYTGAAYQSDVQAVYDDARWFDTTTGRWTSRDPDGMTAGDPNFYRYAGNGPTDATDPSGRRLYALNEQQGKVETWLEKRGIRYQKEMIETPADQKNIWLIDVVPADIPRLLEVIDAEDRPASWKRDMRRAVLENVGGTNDLLLRGDMGVDHFMSLNRSERHQVIAAEAEFRKFSVDTTEVKAFNYWTDSWGPAWQGVKDGAVLEANGATGGLVPGLNAQAAQLRQEYGDGIANISEGAGLFASTVFLGPKLPVKAQVGGALGLTFGGARQTAQMIDGTRAPGNFNPVELAQAEYGGAALVYVAGAPYLRPVVTVFGGWEAGSSAIDQISQGHVATGIVDATGAVLSFWGLGRGRARCFPAGTPVHAEGGLKAVEAVAPGERVWAYDHRQLRWVLRPVLRAFRLLHAGPMVTLRVRGETLRATGGHPFWVVRGEGLAGRPLPRLISAYEAGGRQPGRWVLAQDLRAGDELVLRGAGVVPLESVELAEVEETVYNFHVAELQNYAVGASGVLVHNSNEDGLPPLMEPEEGTTLQTRADPATPGLPRGPGTRANPPPSGVQSNGFRFTEYYYNRLWTGGRPAPGFRAESILNGMVGPPAPDPLGYPGFFRYVHEGWEMVYNPTTGVVSHLQPIKR
jgi:RHS repeat-associated protein